MLLGILPPFRGLLYCVAQFLGSILASAILLGLTGTLSVKYAVLSFLYHNVLTFSDLARFLVHALLQLKAFSSKCLSPVRS